MQALSVKLDEAIFSDTTAILKGQKISRNAYFNAAINAYNALQKRKSLGKKLAAESAMVSSTSLEMLKELEQIVDLHEQ